MAQELVYTSAPKGLRLGSSGFCAVACTRGMAPNYMELLESLSGYTAFYPLSHPDARLNPTAHSHYRFIVGGRPAHVLSRVAFAGADYSQRSNKIAHHVALDTAERSDGGPAWVMRQPGFFVEQWEGEPAFVEEAKRIPPGDAPPRPCETWASVMGDAGWAGALAQAFCDDPRAPSFIIFEPGMPVLDLAAEALALLPVGERWNVTFNTCFTTLPIGTACCWRFCLPNAEALRVARGTAGVLTLDLRRGADQPAEARRWLSSSGALVGAARTGRHAEPAFAVEAAGAQGSQPAAGVRKPRLALESAPARDKPPSALPAPLERRERRGWLWLLLAASLAGNAALVTERALGRRTPAGAAQPTARKQDRVAAVDKALAEKMANLESQAAQGADDRRRLETELETEKGRAAHEKRALTGQLEEARARAAELEKRLAAAAPPVVVAAEPPKATEPVLPKARALASLGVMLKASEAMLAGGVHHIPLSGVTPEWRVIDAGWWDKERPAAPVAGKVEEGEFRIAGPHAVEPGAILYAVIGAVKGGVSVRRGSVANADQAARCVKDIAWLKLAGPEPEGREILMFTRAAPSARLQLTVQRLGGPEGRDRFVCAGQSPLPAVFAGAEKSLRAFWDKAGLTGARIVPGKVGLALRLATEPASRRDDAVAEATELAKSPARVMLDGACVASFEVTPP